MAHARPLLPALPALIPCSRPDPVPSPMPHAPAVTRCSVTSERKAAKDAEATANAAAPAADRPPDAAAAAAAPPAALPVAVPADARARHRKYARLQPAAYMFWQVVGYQMYVHNTYAYHCTWADFQRLVAAYTYLFTAVSPDVPCPAINHFNSRVHAAGTYPGMPRPGHRLKGGGVTPPTLRP